MFKRFSFDIHFKLLWLVPISVFPCIVHASVFLDTDINTTAVHGYKRENDHFAFLRPLK